MQEVAWRVYFVLEELLNGETVCVSRGHLHRERWVYWFTGIALCVGWARHVARMRVGKGACWAWAETPEIKRSLGKPKRRYEYNIRRGLNK